MTWRVKKYLLQRGLTSETVDVLLNIGLLFEDVRHNAVFRGTSFGEVHGTGSVRFKGIVKGSIATGSWVWGRGSSLLYVAESAIDALSLYELQEASGMACDSSYASIGGVGKQKALDCLQATWGDNLILAFDADLAGYEAANRNPTLSAIWPDSGKDWNECLCLKLSSWLSLRG